MSLDPNLFYDSPVGVWRYPMNIKDAEGNSLSMPQDISSALLFLNRNTNPTLFVGGAVQRQYEAFKAAYPCSGCSAPWCSSLAPVHTEADDKLPESGRVRSKIRRRKFRRIRVSEK